MMNEMTNIEQKQKYKTLQFGLVLDIDNGSSPKQRANPGPDIQSSLALSLRPSGPWFWLLLNTHGYEINY